MAKQSSKIDLDYVTQFAQSLLKSQPVVVIGSGATIPHGLPSMSAVAEMLVQSLSFSAPSWHEFCKVLDETKDLERSMLEVALPLEIVEQVVDAIWKQVTKSDLIAHQHLISDMNPFPLAELFAYLLRTATSQLSVVTTNYDRIAEYAANHVHAYVSTGFTAGWLQRFEPATVIGERPPAPAYEGHIRVLKVHGSLDWFRDSMGNTVATPLPSDIPEGMRPLIVTPGVSKYREVHKDPFRTVMSASDDVLRKAQSFICIGYGFNDEHVQPILLNKVMKDKTPVVLITRNLTKATKKAFFKSPPSNFLFLEESASGTTVYNREYAEGASLKDVSAWDLQQFIKLIQGQPTS